MTFFFAFRVILGGFFPTSILAQNYYDYYNHYGTQWYTTEPPSNYLDNYGYYNLSGYPNHDYHYDHYDNEIDSDYQQDFYYEPQLYHQEIQKKTNQNENVIISPHPVTQAIKRFFSDLKSRQFNLAGNSKYLALAITLGTLGLAGLIYQVTKNWREEHNRTISRLTRRIESLENNRHFYTNYNFDAYYGSTFSQTLRTTVTENCNKLAEITNLAYSGGATTANNYNFIQRLIGIATNSCPAL